MKSIYKIGYNKAYDEKRKGRNSKMEELDLKELFNIFWSRKNYIFLIVAICIVIGIIYSFVFVEPKYKAEADLLLAQTNNSQTVEETTGTSITANDLTLNQKLVPTYSKLLKTDRVIDKVINNLNIDVTPEQLKNNVTVSAVEDTQLIKITVTDANPHNAKVITDEISDVFIEEIAHAIYKMDNVMVVNPANEPNAPYNVNHARDVLMFAFAGLVLAIIYALVANMLDTTVKTTEDIEKKLGLSVISKIPLYNFNSAMKPVSKGGRK